MEQLVFPNYENSILNLITTILKKYKVNTLYQELQCLQKEFQKPYDNIVLLVLDGMGDHIINYHLPNGIFQKHKYGCYSKEVKNCIKEIEKEVEKMVYELKETNTLLLISADHGHIDIKKFFNIIELKELQECFVMPPFLESRCISFFIKNEKRQEFEETFQSKFQKEYKLYSKKEFLDSSLLGRGEKNKKIDDIVGDYVAVAISDTSIKLNNYYSIEKMAEKKQKANHCGLTKKEMEVPLMVFDLN